MTELKEVYKCEVCGNIVEVLHTGSGELVCCEKPMVLQKAKTEDPELGEKHVPVISGKVVKIGSVEHPMTEEHYIEWIEATSSSGCVCKIALKPGDKPEAEFDFDVVSARCYCNLHGLWVS